MTVTLISPVKVDNSLKCPLMRASASSGFKFAWQRLCKGDGSERLRSILSPMPIEKPGGAGPPPAQ